MIRNLVEVNFDALKKYIISACNSNDSKPTTGIITGSKLYEVDTGIQYEFDEDSAAWYAVGLSPQEITDAINAWLDDHPEATTTVQDGSITYAKLYSALQAEIDKIGELETAMETKAEVDGYYESMTVGDAEQLVATVGVNDKVPYLFRTSGGSADIGDREVDKVVGGSFPWNQYRKIPATDQSGTVRDVVITDNRDGSFKLNGTVSDNGNALGQTIPILTGHKYLCLVEAPACLTFPPNYNTTPGNKIVAAGTSTESQTVSIYLAKNTVYDNLVIKPQIFDLTQLFGATIADYIYSLETSTPGAGVAWFRKLFPKPYYAYNAGSMESVETDLHKMTGFNAYNHATGKAKVVGGHEYEIVGTYTSLSMNGETITPVSGKFTPAESGEITVTGGDDSTTCIHLRWDGERDGEYEPYVAHEYALSPVVLRGIPKLDSGNKLYYDGDTYEADGTVTRRFGIVDLGTLNWTRYTTQTEGKYRFGSSGIGALVKLPESMSVIAGIRCSKYAAVTGNGPNSNTTGIAIHTNGNVLIYDPAYDTAEVDAFKAAMSGVYLVYELATPTTEQANPYQTPQIVDDWGTEEYRDALATAQSNPRDVAIPVGHDTTYRNNLRAKLEMAPESPSGNGDYILRQTNGQNEYVALEKELPTLPTEDGTYSLKCTVSGTTKTLAWEADAT